MSIIPLDLLSILQPITHEIEVTFNGEQVPGSPFLCRVFDPASNLGIREIPVQVCFEIEKLYCPFVWKIGRLIRKKQDWPKI